MHELNISQFYSIGRDEMVGGSILPRDEHRLQAIRERDTRGEDWTLNGRKKSKHEYNIDKYHNVNLFSTSQKKTKKRIVVSSNLHWVYVTYSWWRFKLLQTQRRPYCRMFMYLNLHKILMFWFYWLLGRPWLRGVQLPQHRGKGGPPHPALLQRRGQTHRCLRSRRWTNCVCKTQMLFVCIVTFSRNVLPF